ncbi:hypothetical protein Q8A67_000854 [Cirrhinus molitorella]|uniref:Monocarboxylate transporter 3 n=1 Tax=Cirrhinus molitorella TaxID=172907 RepID=A0AA88U0J7_9TELE|nr:hypothetical protein Q8A67_000854 [Cirrhinus molitorella]
MGGVALDDSSSGVKAPDGGWGWAVLFGCFIITGFSYAFPKAVSVFFKELIREFDVGYSDTAWISSILLAMLYGTEPLDVALAKTLCFAKRPLDGRRTALSSWCVCQRAEGSDGRESRSPPPRPVPPISPAIVWQKVMLTSTTDVPRCLLE